MALGTYQDDSSPTASDDKGNARFQHQPLNDPRRQIRLIRLLPQYEGGIILCTLRHTKLNSNYVALSYVWGPPQPAHDISIDSQTFTIRENLWQFLARLCQKSRFRQSFWIDQICINQQDITEKNHQVNIMGKIYSQAKTVFVWLGDGHEELLRAMIRATRHPFCLVLRWYHILMRKLMRDLSPGYFPVTWRWAQERSEERFLYSFSHLLSAQIGTHERRFELFDELDKNSYWTRAWTTQEFFLARDLKIVSGQSEVSLEIFQRSCLEPRRQVNRGDLPSGAGPVSVYLWGAGLQWHRARHRNKKHRRPPITLGRLLLQFRYPGRDCEKPFDNIYSLLGLVEGECRVKADYSKDPSTLHREVFISEWDRSIDPYEFSSRIAANLKLDTEGVWQELLKHLDLPADERARDRVLGAVWKARALLASENDAIAELDGSQRLRPSGTRLEPYGVLTRLCGSTAALPNNQLTRVVVGR